jgi:hypothetical protein
MNRNIMLPKNVMMAIVLAYMPDKVANLSSQDASSLPQSRSIKWETKVV